MKKRLRKKKRVGEFQVFVFRIAFRFSASLGMVERNTLLDDFIMQAIEANGLQFGGGGSQEIWDGYAESAGPYGSPTETQREAVKHWLEKDSRILEFEVGPLVDGNAT